MREKLAIIFAIVLVCGLCQAQKPKEDVNESIRLELESKRVEVTVWKERHNREYESRVHVEAQLSQLRAAVAKAAKL